MGSNPTSDKGFFPDDDPSPAAVRNNPHRRSAVVAEWLRRLTRNLTRDQIPSGSVGSNPTNCEGLFLFRMLRFDQAIQLSHDGLKSD